MRNARLSALAETQRRCRTSGPSVSDDVIGNFHCIDPSSSPVISSELPGGVSASRIQAYFGTRHLSQMSELRCRVEEPLRSTAGRPERTGERGRRGPTDGKTSEGVMNYSCPISAYEATWKPFTVERSGYDTFYGSSHCKYPLFRRFEITAKHLPNTNLRGLADHKRTELTKRHLHIPPSCTRGLDNYLHFGT